MRVPRVHGRRCVATLMVAATSALVSAANASAAPAAFSLASPAHAAYVNTSTPKLTWTPTTSGAGMDRYDVVIDESVVGVVDAGDCSTTCEFTSDALTEGRHEWSVAAVDATDETTGSGSDYFFVDITPPTGPMHGLPPDGVVTQDGNIRFQWTGDTRDRSPVTTYELEVDGVVRWTGLTGSPEAMSFDPGPHTWRVNAVDAAGNRGGSQTWSFSVVRPLPALTLTARPQNVSVGHTVALAAAFGAGAIADAQFSWWFSDPRFPLTIGGPTQQIRFATPGARLVMVRATASGDRERQAQATVHVGVPPPPGSPGISITRGARFSSTPAVDIAVVWPVGATTMSFSNAGGAPPITVPVGRMMRWRLDDNVRRGQASTVLVTFDADFNKTVLKDQIVLDAQRPKVSRAALRRARLVVTATDDISGVARVQTAIDRARPAKALPYTRVLRLAKRTRVLWVRVIDRAGNRSAWRRVKHA